MQSTEAHLKHLVILQGNAITFMMTNAINIATHQGRLERFGRMVMGFEGSPFKLGLRELSDEI